MGGAEDVLSVLNRATDYRLQATGLVEKLLTGP
jgi:hypothetical protein